MSKDTHKQYDGSMLTLNEELEIAEALEDCCKPDEIKEAVSVSHE